MVTPGLLVPRYLASRSAYCGRPNPPVRSGFRVDIILYPLDSVLPYLASTTKKVLPVAQRERNEISLSSGKCFVVRSTSRPLGAPSATVCDDPRFGLRGGVGGKTTSDSGSVAVSTPVSSRHRQDGISGKYTETRNLQTVSGGVRRCRCQSGEIQGRGRSWRACVRKSRPSA